MSKNGPQKQKRLYPAFKEFLLKNKYQHVEIVGSYRPEGRGKNADVMGINVFTQQWHGSYEYVISAGEVERKFDQYNVDRAYAYGRYN